MGQSKRIAALSVAPQELEEIRRLLERVRGRLAMNWQWSTEADADVLLIDVDSVYGHMDWLRASAAGRRTISLTNRPAAEDEAVLKRPVTADGLIGALRAFDAPAVGPASVDGRRTPPAPKAAAAPPSRPDAAAPAQRARGAESAPPVEAPPARRAPAPDSGAAVAAEPDAPAATAAPPASATAPAETRSEPPPGPMTLADYLNATALPGPARLTRGDAPALTVDAANDCWFGPSSLKALLPYCTGTIERGEWQPVSPAVMEGLRAAGGAQPLARLLWLIALANSAGQLLPGLSPNARYRLARWPQIEREFPKHFRIATVMMKGWATLSEISEQAGATLTEVIDLVNAYTVSGHAESEADGGGAAAVAATATPIARLARLLRTPIGGG